MLSLREHCTLLNPTLRNALTSVKELSIDEFLVTGALYTDTDQPNVVLPQYRSDFAELKSVIFFLEGCKAGNDKMRKLSLYFTTRLLTAQRTDICSLSPKTKIKIQNLIELNIYFNSTSILHSLFCIFKDKSSI